jgi:serine/threonine protein kinase
VDIYPYIAAHSGKPEISGATIFLTRCPEVVLQDEMRLESGLVLNGRYRLVERIGAGAMGEVWRGVDLGVNRPIAIKVLSSQMATDEDGIVRFRREAETAAALQHPGITMVFDIETGGPVVYLVMELLQGKDLLTMLGEHPGGLPVDRVVELGGQIAAALAAAHSRGIVHRDIKPANLFLQNDGRVKICDFGIARLTDGTALTATGSLLGTPRYMAPEQFAGQHVDQSADLYALGGVMYELLTGKPASSEAASLAELMYWHFNTDPEPPSTRRPGIPAGLDRLVLALLAKDPRQRPPSASAVAQFLRQGPAAAQATAALPPLPPPPAKKSRRGLIAAGSAVVLALAAAGTFVAVQGSGGKPRPKATVSADAPLVAVNGRVPGQAAPGSTLKIGQRAIIPLPQPNGTTDVAGITVTSLTQGTQDQLKQAKLYVPDTPSSLFIVRFTITDLGGADPYLDWDFSQDFGGVLADGSTRISDSIGAKLPGCDDLTVNDAGFTHGATYNGCALLNPIASQGAVTEVVWVGKPYGNPIEASGPGVIWK